MSKRNRNRNQQKKPNDASPSTASDKTEGPDSDEEGGQGDGANAAGGESAAAQAAAPSDGGAAGAPAAPSVETPNADADSAGGFAPLGAAVEQPAVDAPAEQIAEVVPVRAAKPARVEPAKPDRVEPPKRATPQGPIYDALAPLVERLRAGRCVLWAGSGLDQAAGGVGFRGLVEKLLSQLPPSEEVSEARELVARRPFLVAGFVKRRLGDKFNAALREATTSPSTLPEEVRMLGELPFRAVLTTGFSDLLQRAFTRDGQEPPVYTAHTVATREGRGRYLLKALGDPASPDGAIFSARDFQGLLGEEGLAAAVRDFYRNRTILFIGVDPPVDVDRLFVRLLQGTPLEGVEHYAVLPGMTRLEREELESSYKLKVIPEDDVLTVIRALREAVGDVTEALPEDDDLEGWLGLLTAEPDRPDALDKIHKLEERLRAKNDHERLLDLHLGMVEIENSHATRAYRLSQVARLFEQSFGDPGKAFTALLAAYKEDPEHGNPDELERLAEATSSYADLVGEYVQVAPSLPPAARAAHWTRVARLYADKLGQIEYALHALDEALKAGPAQRDTLELRLSVLRRAEKWKDLAAVLGAVAEGEESLGRKSELYLEQGDIFETRLNNLDGAVKAYRGALEADPGSTDVLHALELIHRRRNDWTALVDVLDQKAKAAPADRSAEMRLEAAQIVDQKLSDRKASVVRYESLRAEDQSLAALRALEKLYELEGRTDDYLKVLAEQAGLVKETSEKLTLYRRLAIEWEDRDGGRAEAANAYEKMITADPKSEEPFRSLARIYTSDEKWTELVDVLRRQMEVPGADKLAIQLQLARTTEERIKDPARALETWQAIYKLAPANEDALAALTRLYESTGQWDKSAALLDQRIENAKDKTQKAELLAQAGRLASERLGDTKKAEELLHRAIELDHTYVPAMTAMVELYRKSGEFLRAAKLLTEAADFTTNRLEKTRLLVEAGEIYDSLDQRQTATDLLLKALSVDPEHVEAANRVSDLLWKAERWADLVPVLDMLTRKEADKPTMKQRWLRLGRASRNTGDAEKAGRAYIKAADLDPTDVEAQRACGDIFFADGKWKEARESFKAVLGHGGDDIADAERVELYYRLGECDRKLGQVDKAKNFYAKALEIDPTHRPTILARMEMDSDDPIKLIEAKRALLATAGDEERVRLLTEIGQIHLEKIEDADGAVAAWREAIVIKPDSRQLLHRCLDVYVEKKDWVQSLEALTRLTDLETVAAIRAKLKFTRAIIHLDELSETEQAIKLLSEANDDNPGEQRVAKRLEDLLIQSESWKELQRYYRKVIKRMAPEAETDSAEVKRERLRIWTALADVSIEKLGEFGVGLPALEVVTTLDTSSPKRREQLADLLVEAGPDQADKAIQAHQALLRVQKDRIASYKALRRVYAETKQPEKAIAVAYALNFLKKGSPEDEPLVQEAKKRPMQPARRNLDDDMWTKYLMHPDEDKLVNALFGLLIQPLILSAGVLHKDVPLLKKDKVEDTDPRGFAKGVRYVSNALNVKFPYEIYVKYEQREATAIANCKTDAKPPVAVPCLIVGQPLLGDKRSERELVYELSKRLAYFRTDRYIRNVLPQPAALGVLIDAAVLAASEGEKATAAEALKIVSQWKTALPPKTLEQIVAIGKKLKGGPKGEQLAGSWLASTELTSTHAAFLLVGDLETTARFVAAEPATVSPLPTVARLKDLIAFTVSEECFALRKHLGLMA